MNNKRRYKHNLSNYKLLTCDAGELVPIGLTEVLPGDTFQLATALLVRASPLIAPVMHPIRISVHHFFVPHRIVWPTFEQFITGGPDGNDATIAPRIDAFSVTAGSLGDYYGLPIGTQQALVSALPFRGYNAIWNEFYRDQDLMTARVNALTDGNDTTTDTSLANVAWEKDYFTTARPWAVKGTAPTVPVNLFNSSGVSTPVTTSAANPSVLQAGNNPSQTVSFRAGPTIDDIRRSFALQRYQEARARYGSRYTEYLAYLGVFVDDSRLQDPEYLGGGSEMLQISEVLQTAPTTSGNTAGLADLKGHGIGGLRSNRFRKYFTEHGFIHSLCFIRPKTMYTQGVHRHWFRNTRFDYWQKELEGIGQQPILNREIRGTSGTASAVFGFTNRYEEYRSQWSTIAGDYRSTLNFWHLARDIADGFSLNSSFVTSNPSKRIFAAQSADTYWMMANHSIQARRLVGPAMQSRIL